MAILANFEGIGEFALLAVSWPVAACFALLALILALPQATRGAAWWFAAAGLITSIPIGIVHVLTVVRELPPYSGTWAEYLAFVAVTLAPPAVALGVLWFTGRR